MNILTPRQLDSVLAISGLQQGQPNINTGLPMAIVKAHLAIAVGLRLNSVCKRTYVLLGDDLLIAVAADSVHPETVFESPDVRKEKY